MKLRSDFVTNSSSSSFVIGRAGDDTTVDSVFHIIQEFYKEYYAAKDALMRDMDKYGLVYDNNKGCFNFKNGKSWDDKNSKINKTIEKIYGIDTWCYFGEPEEWFNFETYQEYVEYWQTKMAEAQEDTHSYSHAPFSIIDFEGMEEYIPLHDGYKWMNEGKVSGPRLASDSSEFGWYLACGDRFVAGEEHDPEYCNYCSFDKEECKKIREQFKTGELTNENALVMVLGKISIRSECGYIPDFVVDKLRKIANYSCNHMG